MEYLIYGKANCDWCSKAFEDILNVTTNEDRIVYKSVDSNPEAKEELLNRIPDVTTVPQIFIDDLYIGGYTELTEYLNK